MGSAAMSRTGDGVLAQAGKLLVPPTQRQCQACGANVKAPGSGPQRPVTFTSHMVWLGNCALMTLRTNFSLFWSGAKCQAVL